MVVDSVARGFTDAKSQLIDVVSVQKFSSLEMISRKVGRSEDDTRQAIEEMLNEGVLHGRFSEDGNRFFLSDVRVSEAPILREHQDYVIEEVDNRLGKFVFIAGILMMISGLVARGFISVNPAMEHIGGAIFMVGMAVMAAGWLQVGRNTPSNVK
jgi:hypothetical protein